MLLTCAAYAGDGVLMGDRTTPPPPSEDGIIQGGNTAPAEPEGGIIHGDKTESLREIALAMLNGALVVF